MPFSKSKPAGCPRGCVWRDGRVPSRGKTLGALLIAYGLTEDWSRVALIDTEHERARFYANRADFTIGEFLYAPMSPPFSPEKYKALVQEGAQAVGPEGVVIVDSLSHAWNAEGGILEIKDRIAARSGQNSYTAWNEAGREQSRLVNAILAVPCHTIVTMRSKMEYALEENERGKKQPVKLGLAPVQRDDTEYEFDIVLDVARSHVATASKDTTFLDRFGVVFHAGAGTGPACAAGLQRKAESRSCPRPYVKRFCGGVVGVRERPWWIAPSERGGSSPETVRGARPDSASGTGQSRPNCEPCFRLWNRARQANEAAGLEG
jgi:hypothetical protein